MECAREVLYFYLRYVNNGLVNVPLMLTSFLQRRGSSMVTCEPCRRLSYL